MDAEQLTLISQVSTILKKGIVIKFSELNPDNCTGIPTNTYFRQTSGKVYVKNRNVKLVKPTTKDGWEIDPLEFEDWWVDIIVDGNLEHISYLHYFDGKEHILWSRKNRINLFGYLSPPPGVEKCTLLQLSQPMSCLIPHSQNNFTLKEMAVIAFRDHFGKCEIDKLNYMFDSQMIKATYRPYVWWVPLV